jgi:steroid delta-isomerase-like uncharacterized protein
MRMRQANQEVVLRHHKEIWSEGRLESIPELLAHDFVAHHPGAPDWSGLDDVKAVVQRTRAAFPDFHESVEDVMVDGDRVITRFVARGTHLGTYQGLPPTGKSFDMAEIGIFRMADGKIVEKWARSIGLACTASSASTRSSRAASSCTKLQCRSSRRRILGPVRTGIDESLS